MTPQVGPMTSEEGKMESKRQACGFTLSEGRFCTESDPHHHDGDHYRCQCGRDFFRAIRCGDCGRWAEVSR